MKYDRIAAKKNIDIFSLIKNLIKKTVLTTKKTVYKLEIYNKN